jgi:hypothetical protein
LRADLSALVVVEYVVRVFSGLGRYPHEGIGRSGAFGGAKLGGRIVGGCLEAFAVITLPTFGILVNVGVPVGIIHEVEALAHFVAAVGIPTDGPIRVPAFDSVPCALLGSGGNLIWLRVDKSKP